MCQCLWLSGLWTRPWRRRKKQKQKFRRKGNKWPRREGGGVTAERTFLYSTDLNPPPWSKNRGAEEKEKFHSSNPEGIDFTHSLLEKRKEKKKKEQQLLWTLTSPGSRLSGSGTGSIYLGVLRSEGRLQSLWRYVSVLWKAVHKKPHHTTVTWCVQGRSSLVLPTWWLICRWERGLKLTLF